MASPHTPRLLNLDLLRLLSALMVLFFHYGFRMQISGEGGGMGFPELAPVAMWFDAGLLIFFTISGYVIAMSAEQRPPFEFAAGRLARLWPTFVLCATISALVLTIEPLPTLPPPTLQQWLAHLFMISRALGQPFLDGAYWTIVYEIVFYGWVFLFSAFGLFSRHWRAIIIAWLGLSAANELLLHSGALQKLLITEYSGFFAFGLCLYKLQGSARIGDFCVLTLAALWASTCVFLTEPDFLQTYLVARSDLGLMLSGPLSLTAVVAAVFAPTLPLRSSLAIALGGLTYPLYLLHQNIGYTVFAHFADMENRWMVLIILLCLLALISWTIASHFEPRARKATFAACLRLRESLVAQVAGRRRA